MTLAAVERRSNRYMTGLTPSGLYEVLDLILDKGLVIDAYVRVSLLGTDLLTIDTRAVMASVDTYLRFADAVGRLDLAETETQGVPGMMTEVREGGTASKTKGVIEGVKEAVSGDDKRPRQPTPRRRRDDS